MLYEYVVKVPRGRVDEAIEKLNTFGIYNLYYEPPIEIIQVENGYDFQEIEQETVELKIYAEEKELSGLPHTFFPLIEKALQIPQIEIAFRELDDQQWSHSFEDIDLGNGWVLCYSGDDSKYPDKQVMKFEPQAAFGTGLHETTQDCLRILLDKRLEGKSVLDLGTGSGVLTVAAGLRGADKLHAIDYEPVEREIRLNAELNQLSQQLDIDQADLLLGDYRIRQDYDLVIMNIGADETVEILDRHQLAYKTNDFLVSGIVEWNAGRVTEAFQKQGFIIKDKRQSKEWITINFGKEQA
ncbi:50S ribosomal protein L11 methyltransferase [Sediminibacillus albus]|uniref:Ribosomal protein L11 methyltransferase n=1 Tax=Sediminibacillus albus TaxID=407036 RepID=A0A1G8WVD9_9BACI|nr:50S ribosomal protein L11 methyltransferase [Sediminibacillus albus]SDJ81550.1 ribosomal protein L11 methyltransferase [Sediminibacillus albus]